MDVPDSLRSLRPVTWPSVSACSCLYHPVWLLDVPGSPQGYHRTVCMQTVQGCLPATGIIPCRPPSGKDKANFCVFLSHPFQVRLFPILLTRKEPSTRTAGLPCRCWGRATTLSTHWPRRHRSPHGPPGPRATPPHLWPPSCDDSRHTLRGPGLGKRRQTGLPLPPLSTMVMSSSDGQTVERPLLDGSGKLCRTEASPVPTARPDVGTSTIDSSLLAGGCHSTHHLYPSHAEE